MDVVLLSRLQFALTIMFHYLFPPLDHRHGGGAGLPGGACTCAPQDPIYETAARFWTKIFALNFAIGVATGIVMEFQFGTNWAVYSRFVGDVFGSALAAEGIFAFFLESGFLAVLVFGWDKVSAALALLRHPDGVAGLDLLVGLDRRRQLAGSRRPPATTSCR